MLKVKKTTVNYLNNPIGVGSNPEFGWVIESDRKDVIQKAYRIIISEDEEFLEVVCDTGKVESSDSTSICVKEFSANPSTKYFYKVKIWDEKEESDFSILAFFITSMLDNKFEGEFISAETKDDAKNSKGTYVRNEFRADKEVKRAIVHATALGLYKLFINGKKVGNDEMTPGWTSYHKHLRYQTYDVTNYIDNNNVIGAMLGAGWYKGEMGFNHKKNNYGTQTALLIQLEILYKDGSNKKIVTDDSWRGNDSPILFSEIYDGEIYDATKEIPGWNSAGFNDEGWDDVEVINYDKDVLKCQAGAKVTVNDIIKPVKMFITPKGDRVIDFGQNLTGQVRFKVNGKKGDKVILRHFEVLDKDKNVYLDNLRKAKQKVEYTLKGDGVETYRPSFTFSGFQYIKIEKYPGEIDINDFEALTLHSKMDKTIKFECSNKYINQLQHNILWGMKGNFLDIPTDCPQRDERLGWTGDAQIFSKTACYLMNTYNFFSKWLIDLKAEQTKEGGVSHVVPDILSSVKDKEGLLSKGTHSAAAWADAAVIIPWDLYVTYGSKEVLKEQYDSMKAWIDFMKAHSKNGIWKYKLQFGDWVALDAKEGSYFGATPQELICSAYFAHSTRIFKETAKVLGNLEDYEKYSKLYEEIVDGYQNEFFNKNGSLKAKTQTAHVVSLFFELTPNRYKEKIVSELIKLIKENGGHLDTGFVGTPYICHALSECGHTKEAYDLLLKDDFPSWLYQVKMGATTIWEHWDGIKPDGSMWSADMNSFNHYAYGAIGEWMYSVMAGIKADEENPGYKHTIIKPHIDKRFEYVDACYSSVYGDIKVRWECDEKNAKLKVSMPPNTKATVDLSERKDSDEKLIEIGSGDYEFNYKI